MRQLFSLYGTLGIQSFGLFIVIGIILFTYLFLRDPRRNKLICPQQYYNLLSYSLIAGFVGGRLLYAATNWQSIPSWLHIFAFWEGGYSLLGGIVMLILFAPYYLKKNQIPCIPLIDLVCVYAPYYNQFPALAVSLQAAATACLHPRHGGLSLPIAHLGSLSILHNCIVQFSSWASSYFYFFWAKNYLKKMARLPALI